jgi:hypothetical protein
LFLSDFKPNFIQHLNPEDEHYGKQLNVIFRTATRWAHIQFFRALLDMPSVIVEEEGPDGMTPLRLCARFVIQRNHVWWPETSDKAEILQELINKGCNPNASDRNGNTALIEAAAVGRLDLVKLLIDAGADINATNKYGNTALIEASAGGYLDVVKYLLSKGADDGIENKQGRAAVDVVPNIVGEEINLVRENVLHSDFLYNNQDVVSHFVRDKLEAAKVSIARLQKTLELRANLRKSRGELDPGQHRRLLSQTISRFNRNDLSDPDDRGVALVLIAQLLENAPADFENPRSFAKEQFGQMGDANRKALLDVLNARRDPGNKPINNSLYNAARNVCRYRRAQNTGLGMVFGMSAVVLGIVAVTLLVLGLFTAATGGAATALLVAFAVTGIAATLSGGGSYFATHRRLDPTTSLRYGTVMPEMKSSAEAKGDSERDSVVKKNRTSVYASQSLASREKDGDGVESEIAARSPDGPVPSQKK